MNNFSNNHHIIPFPCNRNDERGNILFLILIAVMLIGTLSAVIMRGSSSESANIDSEALIIRASEVQRYGSEIERAVLFIMQNEAPSESDLRFAHPDAHADYGDISISPEIQIFHRLGGGAAYRRPPSGINDNSAWEFYGGTAIPSMGSNRADLIMVLPNVTAQFCERINNLNEQALDPQDTGLSSAAGADPGDCLHIGALGRFDGAQQFYTTINSVDEATFTQDPHTNEAAPAPQGCVTCALDSNRHFYHVIMAR